MIEKLCRYRAPDMLKKEIFTILLNNVKSELIQKWNRDFERLDTDNTGMVKIKELIRILEKEGGFKPQIKHLKQLNKNDPNLKIQYSDFLLRVVDLKKEIKAADIASAFVHIDADKSGRINAKDLRNYLIRRGEDVSEEEAQEILGKAEHKAILKRDLKYKNSLAASN